MRNLNAYLRFNDSKCREAMNFYKDILGGEVTFQTIGESPMAKDMPADKQHNIMHASFKKNDIEFFASDMMRDKAVIGDNVVLAINCESEDELNTLFKKFSEGGQIFMEPEKVFWGAIFAVVTDKYGIEWMLNLDTSNK